MMMEAEAGLTPAEHELRRASRLSSRGGRSERDCGLSSAPGRDIEELQPRAQAFADRQMRATLRQLNLEANVVALRPAAIESDQRKVRIRNFVKLFPGVKGRALCLVLDKAGIPVLPRWARLTGSRLWADCWAHSATKNAVRKYLSQERKEALA
jgi:hypothetical protein